MQEANDSDSIYRLLINGDFVDFLQFTSVPEGGGLDGEPLTGKNKSLGLAPAPRKPVTSWSCYSRAMRFFRALAAFVGAGNELIISPGNHDIEWIIPEVRDNFKTRLGCLWSEAGGKDTAALKKRISFSSWYYHDPVYGIFAEHGCQYDDANSYDYLLSPFRQDGTMELPAGSFFVRYLVNQVEQLYPSADNLKPMTKFIRWAAQQRKMYTRGEIFKVIRSLMWILGKASPIPADWAEKMHKRQEQTLAKLASESGLSIPELHKLQSHWVPSAIHHKGSLRLLRSFLVNSKLDHHYYRIKACAAESIVRSRYLIFGHTHEADLFEIRRVAGVKHEYVNSGSWTKNWAARHEEALLKSENEFVYIHFGHDEEKQAVRMDLLRWDDGLGQGERVRIFADENNDDIKKCQDQAKE